MNSLSGVSSLYVLCNFITIEREGLCPLPFFMDQWRIKFSMLREKNLSLPPLSYCVYTLPREYQEDVYQAFLSFKTTCHHSVKFRDMFFHDLFSSGRDRHKVSNYSYSGSCSESCCKDVGLRYIFRTGFPVFNGMERE